MWRAACTLHLTAIFQDDPREGKRWEEEVAPIFYQAIEVGSIEVFGSRYKIQDESGRRLAGHSMLVEVERTSETRYRIGQFNSGKGIRFHKVWKGGALQCLIDDF
jgi:hypothetical protein